MRITNALSETDRFFKKQLSEGDAEEVLNGIQLALDLAGIEPTIGTAADGVNVVISGLRAAAANEDDERNRHSINAGISLLSMIPFADVLKVLKLRKSKGAVKAARAAKAWIKKSRHVKSYSESAGRVSEAVVLKGNSSHAKEAAKAMEDAVSGLGAHIQVIPWGDRIRIQEIETRGSNAGTGAASIALKTILDVADHYQVVVALFAVPYGNKRLGKSDLVDWYERNGFELRPDGETMVRQPAPKQAAKLKLSGNFTKYDYGDEV